MGGTMGGPVMASKLLAMAFNLITKKHSFHVSPIQ